MVSAWLIFPLAALAVVVIMGHLAALRQDAEMPTSRKRIRTANAVVLLATAFSLAYAFGVADPVAQPRDFALSWMLTTGLLFLVLMLACADSLNTVRLHWGEQRKLRRDLRDAIGRAQRIVEEEQKDRAPSGDAAL